MTSPGRVTMGGSIAGGIEVLFGRVRKSVACTQVPREMDW
jgi:hypothetical protein